MLLVLFRSGLRRLKRFEREKRFWPTWRQRGALDRFESRKRARKVPPQGALLARPARRDRSELKSHQEGLGPSLDPCRGADFHARCNRTDRRPRVCAAAVKLMRRSFA